MEIITLKKKDISDFASARNEFLSKAKSDWVLFLDRDEKLTDYRLQTTAEFSGYKIKRKNYFLGKYVGSEWIIRLGKKNAGRWERRVHETWNIKSHLVGVIDKPVIIHNTAENLHDYITKINYYSDLHALANREEGKTPSIFKIVFCPPAKFLLTLFKSGHVVFSMMQSLHSFLSWSKLYFLRS